MTAWLVAPPVTDSPQLCDAACAPPRCERDAAVSNPFHIGGHSIEQHPHQTPTSFQNARLAPNT